MVELREGGTRDGYSSNPLVPEGSDVSGRGREKTSSTIRQRQELPTEEEGRVLLGCQGCRDRPVRVSPPGGEGEKGRSSDHPDPLPLPVSPHLPEPGFYSGPLTRDVGGVGVPRPPVTPQSGSGPDCVVPLWCLRGWNSDSTTGGGGPRIVSTATCLSQDEGSTVGSPDVRSDK